MPGVIGFLTGKDMPETFGILPVSQDEHALCLDRVRFVGDPVVAVCALTEDQAGAAADAVRIDYEPLATIASIEEALETPEPRIHDYGDEGNVHKKVAFDFGDVDEALASADQVFEDVLYFAGNTHLPIEQHATLVWVDPDGKLTVASSTQTPHYLHRALAQGAGAEAWELLGHAWTAQEDPARAQIAYANALRLARGEAPLALGGRSLREQIADQAVAEYRNEHGIPHLRP